MYFSQDESLPLETSSGPSPFLIVWRFLQTGGDLVECTMYPGLCIKILNEKFLNNFREKLFSFILNIFSNIYKCGSVHGIWIRINKATGRYWIWLQYLDPDLSISGSGWVHIKVLARKTRILRSLPQMISNFTQAGSYSSSSLRSWVHLREVLDSFYVHIPTLY